MADCLLALYKDLSDTPAVEDDDATSNSPSSPSLKSTDEKSPLTPQQLLVQGVGKVSSFAWVLIVAVVVVFVIYMSRRRRPSGRFDENHEA